MGKYAVNTGNRLVIKALFAINCCFGEFYHQNKANKCEIVHKGLSFTIIKALYLFIRPKSPISLQLYPLRLASAYVLG